MIEICFHNLPSREKNSFASFSCSTWIQTSNPSTKSSSHSVCSFSVPQCAPDVRQRISWVRMSVLNDGKRRCISEVPSVTCWTSGVHLRLGGYPSGSFPPASSQILANCGHWDACPLIVMTLPFTRMMATSFVGSPLTTSFFFLSSTLIVMPQPQLHLGSVHKLISVTLMGPALGK